MLQHYHAHHALHLTSNGAVIVSPGESGKRENVHVHSVDRQPADLMTSAVPPWAKFIWQERDLRGRDRRRSIQLRLKAVTLTAHREPQRVSGSHYEHYMTCLLLYLMGNFH